MPMFKCKCCGGDIHAQEGQSSAICPYCDREQSLSKSKNEIVINLFNRANALRLKNEFDKAYETYEKIIADSPDDAEAHWGIVLSKYGIEYIEDPYTHKRIPTCHRMQYESILTDIDYMAAIGNADTSQRLCYENDAKEIANLQKDILEIVRNEPPFDVFICYKEKDENGQRTQESVIANDIYYHLEQEGLKVFYAAITLEDKLGKAYEPYIFAALNSAKVMLVLATKPEHVNAVWVKNEWSRFLKIAKKDRNKLLIPCYRDMDAYDLPEDFSHLQAQDMSKIGFMTDIIRGVKKVLTENEQSKSTISNETDNKKHQELMIDDGGGMYIGEIFANQPSGSGRCEYKDGRIYEGEWKYGSYSGKGKLIYTTGDIYTGEFVDGKRHGQGIMTWKTGQKWCGTFQNDAFGTGEGFMQYNDGNFYIGSMVDGKREGKGTLHYTKSSQYTPSGEWSGIWKNHWQWNGSGLIHYNDKAYYVGPIVNGKREGKGTIYYTQCSRKGGLGEKGQDWVVGGSWTGEWRNDYKCDGEGIDYCHASGIDQYGKKEVYDHIDSYYIGEMKHGRWHGKGTLYYVIWENGRKTFGENGKSWCGTWKDGSPWEGSGTWKFTSGDRGWHVSYHSVTVKNGKMKDHDQGCYIATCVYGSYDCPQVWTLRRYRDDTLGSTWYGRLFIRTYYAISPTLVKWFGNTNWFKKLWKGKLDRMVANLQAEGVEDTPYEDKSWK